MNPPLPHTLYQSRLHPAVFLVPFVLAIVASLVLLPAATLTSFLLASLAQSLGYTPAQAKHLLLISTLTIITLLFVASLILVSRGYRHSLIQITPPNLLLHTGFITLSKVTLPISEIVCAQAIQPKLGRRLHYATLTLTLKNNTSIDLPFTPNTISLVQLLNSPQTPTYPC